MKLIIDIPEENYKLICSDGRPFLPSYKWIKNGIPLDKIRTEIEQIEINGHIRDVECFRAGIAVVLNVINKYVAESEEQEE